MGQQGPPIAMTYGREEFPRIVINLGSPSRISRVIICRDHLCPAHAGDTQVRRQADPPSEERDDIKIVSQLLIIITNSLEDQHSPENIISS